MSKIRFPMNKISAEKRANKNANVKREAVFIEGKFICPNCFENNYEIIRCEFETNIEKPMRYTGKCRVCGTKIQYNKETPLLKT